MSRMLEALKRLETHSRSVGAAPVSATESPRRPDTPAIKNPPLGEPPVVTEQEIEARLTHAEELAREAQSLARPADRPQTAAPRVEPERRPTFPARRPEPAHEHATARPPVIAPHYARMRERILTQIPRDRSAALLFVHPGDVEELATAVAELAVAMTEAMPGDILAIDANVAIGDGPGGASGGLTDVIGGRTEWYTAVSPTRNPRVVLLPGGSHKAGAALPDEARVRSVIEQFKARFDIVLIDGGPVQNPFATLLARSCDACYVMLTLAQTRQRAVNATLQRLRQAGGRVTGCILAGATLAEAEHFQS